MKNNKIKLIIILILLFIVGIGGFFVYKANHPDEYPYDREARNGIINARSEEEIQDILNKQVEKGMFNVSINSNPQFENGASEGNLWIENVPANQCDFIVKIQLKQDDNKTVFETKKIRPNQNIKDSTLDVKLEKGEYPAVAHFIAYDLETGQKIGSADVNITISILN